MSADIVRKDFIEKNELFDFIKNAFRDGTVPTDKEEFMACFSTETSDGSLCFARQFGEGEDDAVMLFFHPFQCLVPPRYQKHLKEDGPFAMRLLVLEYQKLLASKTDSQAYLSQLAEEMEMTFDINRDSLGAVVYQRFKDSLFEGKEETPTQIANEVAKGFAKYQLKYEEVKAYVDGKVGDFTSNPEKQESSYGEGLPEDRRLK